MENVLEKIEVNVSRVEPQRKTGSARRLTGNSATTSENGSEANASFRRLLNTLGMDAVPPDGRLLKPDEMFDDPRHPAAVRPSQRFDADSRGSQRFGEQVSAANGLEEPHSGNGPVELSRSPVRAGSAGEKGSHGPDAHVLQSARGDTAVPKAKELANPATTVNNILRAENRVASTRSGFDNPVGRAEESSADGNQFSSVSGTALKFGEIQPGGGLAERLARVLNEPVPDVQRIAGGRAVEISSRELQPSIVRPPSTTPAGKPSPKSASGPPVRPPSESGEAREFEKLVRSIRLRLGETWSSARIRLNPPELGRMIVDVRMNQGALEIDVRTESQAGRAIMQERAAGLRTALEAHGIPVDRFDVQMEMQHDHGYSSGRDQEGAGKPGRRNAGDLRFPSRPFGIGHDPIPAGANGLNAAGGSRQRRLDIRV